MVRDGRRQLWMVVLDKPPRARVPVPKGTQGVPGGQRFVDVMEQGG